jgi:hypothetical protein
MINSTSMMRYFVCILAFLQSVWPIHASAQCNAVNQQPLSARGSNYEINVTLDHATKTIIAEQTIRFTNQSPQAIKSLQFYMYLNAFKNTESSFLKGVDQIFGRDYTKRSQDEWGWIHIEQISKDEGADLSAGLKYIQKDDGNTSDQSVLELSLDQAIEPGQTAVFQLKWKAKMPKTIARAGYSKDFYLFCHWFPQLGVYEQNKAGQWHWNCHQFFRTTEFYADFGVYDVYITTDSKFVLGASGCMVSEKKNSNGTTTRHYHAEDVIDFAWSVYPRFQTVEERWKDVQIKLLIAPEHMALAPRYMYALKFAFDYLDKHVGAYPYPSITVVDPPFHGLRSGLMEYPQLITVGTFYGMPKGVRITESLVVHEFVHQYFMAVLASNEKEEAWLDEGFVTYFEDRIIDAAFGEKKALVDVFGYKFGNRELSRLEYTTMQNPREGIVARPGWAFNDNNFKALIYSKTATTLRTVETLVGVQNMDQVLRAYFEKWKFKHPRGSDFEAILKEQLLISLADSNTVAQVCKLFETGIYKAEVLDYAVTRLSNQTTPPMQGVFGTDPSRFSHALGTDTVLIHASVEVQRKGDWIFPVEVLVTFSNGSTQLLRWDGVDGAKTFDFYGKAEIVSATVDPQHKIGLDIDFNNNSITNAPTNVPRYKYLAKAMFWVQTLFQSLSFLA